MGQKLTTGELEAMTSRFYQQPEYQMLLNQYSKAEIQTVIKAYLINFYRQTGHEKAAWNQPQSVVSEITAFLQGKTKQQQAAGLTIIQGFLQALYPHTATAAAPALRAWAKAQQLPKPAALQMPRSVHGEQILTRVQQTAENWVKSFEAKQAKQADASRPWLRFVLGAMSIHIFVKFQLLPQDWTPASMQETVTGFLAAKMPLVSSEYKILPEQLSRLFNFLADSKQMDKAQAKGLAQTVLRAKKQLLINSREPKLFQPDKVLLLAARNEGVNVFDQAQMLDYLNWHLDGHGQPLTGAIAFAAEAGVLVTKNTDQTYRIETKEPAASDHVQSLGKYTWYARTAKSMDTKALKLVYTIHQNPETAALIKQLGYAAVARCTMVIFRSMYAQFLQTPARWEKKAVRTLLGKWKKVLAPADFAVYLKVWAAILQVETTIKAEHLPQLQAVLASLAVPEPASGSGKHKAKIISFAAAKKKLLQEKQTKHRYNE